MKEEQQQKLVEYFLGLMERGEDFVLEQAPDLVQQILAWEWALYCTGYCFGVVFVVSSCVFLFMNRKKIFESWDGDYAFPWAVLSGLLILITTFVSFGMLLCLSTFVQLWVAPKVFLLEYMSSLIK